MRLARFLTVFGAAAMAVQPVLAAAAAPAEPAATAPADPFLPQDALERGLWMQVDEAERDLKGSQLLVRDPALNAYVRSVLCKTVGEERCARVRLYLVRTPFFNASMMPNGTMQVWTGLLLRTQNEAQLAAVLGHEFAHFEKRHSVRLYRDAKAKSAAAAWLAFTGIGLIASFAMAGSLFKFSRDMEKEADLTGLDRMAAAGYDTRQAAVIWEQVLDEHDATRLARGKKAKKRSAKAGLFDSHPASPERIAYLSEAATAKPGMAEATGIAEYRAAMDALWPELVDDQLKMNDYGASEYLLDSLDKANGWSPWLRYARGELYRRRGLTGDYELAITAYSEAIDRGGELPALWRGRGLALRKLGRAGEAQTDLTEYLRRAPDAPDAAMLAMMTGGNT